MKKTFRVGQSNEIVSEGRIFDLHNNYDFSGISMSPGGRVQVSFLPSPDHGRDESPLALIFEGVDYIEMRLGLGKSSERDLEEVGYKSPSDRNDAWLLAEEYSTGLDHLFLRFSGEYFLRIHSESAFLSEEL